MSDDEVKAAGAAVTLPSAPPTDIEHAFVSDDPRCWSRGRKVRTFLIRQCHVMLLTISAESYYSGLSLPPSLPPA